MTTKDQTERSPLSSNSIVQAALNNAYLHEQGVPDMRAKWIAMHYGDDGVPS
ncbi:hypothetical protein OH491_24475 [Termitidicoccus mucosus]|uniref:hypothetical protein n=1 Tax=Termitidicoccus mucosus TaxID=1184151 RepID=UPI002678E735